METCYAIRGMSVEYPHDHDPHYLHQAQEGLLTVWQELPPEHQATMLLVLLKDVMNGEYRAWVLDALQRVYPSQKGEDELG